MGCGSPTAGRIEHEVSRMCSHRNTSLYYSGGSLDRENLLTCSDSIGPTCRELGHVSIVEEKDVSEVIPFGLQAACCRKRHHAFRTCYPTGPRRWSKCSALEGKRED